MHFLYDDRESGAGKTFSMFRYLIDSPGIYLIAVPRVDLIMEHELAFRAMPGNGAMVVKSICSKSGTFSVPCEIKRTMQSWLELGISHGGIFISHEALNLVDWSLPSLQANRWVLFIDESPCPWSYYNRRHPITNTHVQEMLAWSELPISGDKEEDESLKIRPGLTFRKGRGPRNQRN